MLVQKTSSQGPFLGKRPRHAFTLVELLVVIAIIGIFDCALITGSAGGTGSCTPRRSATII